jgi:hypothetical protein
MGLATCDLAALLGRFASVKVRGTTSNTDVLPPGCGQSPIVIGPYSLIGRYISIFTGVAALAGRPLPICVSFAALAGRLLAVPIGFVPLTSRQVTVSQGFARIRESSHYTSRSSRGQPEPMGPRDSFFWGSATSVLLERAPSVDPRGRPGSRIPLYTGMHPPAALSATRRARAAHGYRYRTHGQ